MNQKLPLITQKYSHNIKLNRTVFEKIKNLLVISELNFINSFGYLQ